MARIVTQGFFLLLVMCVGFLLMQYFGPQPDGGSGRSIFGAAATPLSTEVQDLTAKANQGIAEAELLLGLRYADGESVEANDAEAAKWLGRAAQKGNALAEYRLGTLYEKGLGVPLDMKIAADWYAKAAEIGNVKAMHNLAVAYANGNGRDTNYTEAARWFLSAAQRGLADSQFNLAVLHERGLGVRTSLTEAYRWYSIAAAQGDKEFEHPGRSPALPDPCRRPGYRRQGGRSVQACAVRGRGQRTPTAFRGARLVRDQGPRERTPVANPNSESGK